MKRLFPIILFLVMLIPNLASAHAELVNSQPQQGETVKQSIDTLNLQFGEDVEKFINFTITNEKGESIPMDAPDISGKSVLVLTKKPLPNGSYTAKWELVAADGHKNGGELSFKVGQVDAKKSQTEPPAKSEPVNQKTSPDHQTFYISFIVILILIIAIGLFTMFRKRGK